MDDEYRVVEGWNFFTRRWDVCLEIVEGPFFLFGLSLVAAEGMDGAGWGEREREYASGTEPQLAWARSFLCW